MLNKLAVNLFIGVLWLISFLPMWLIILISKVIEACCFRLSESGFSMGLHNKYHVAKTNLKLCFPDKSALAIDQLLRLNFLESIIAILHYGLVFSAGAKRLIRRVKGSNLMACAKHYQQRPIIVISPHFWGLDIGANRMSINFPSYSMMYDDEKSWLRQKLKQARMRFITESGCKVFSRQDGISQVIRKLRQTKRPFYYLPDIDLGEANSIYLPFFAVSNCCTLATLPKLVKLTNALVIPVVTFRKGNHYVVEYFEAWENYPSGDELADVASLNKFVEKMILEHPEQYMWSLKRFGTQPGRKYGAVYAE